MKYCSVRNIKHRSSQMSGLEAVECHSSMLRASYGYSTHPQFRSKHMCLFWKNAHVRERWLRSPRKRNLIKIGHAKRKGKRAVRSSYHLTSPSDNSSMLVGTAFVTKISVEAGDVAETRKLLISRLAMRIRGLPLLTRFDRIPQARTKPGNVNKNLPLCLLIKN